VSAHPIVLRHLWVLRRNRPWQLVVNGVFEPFLYLLSIGLGVGQLIDGLTGDGVNTSYAAFVAPALLATSAMNSAVADTTMSVWWRLREKFYDAMITTPLTVRDIAVGEVVATLLRGAVASTCFLAVISALRLVHSWWALAAIPGALLIAYAFAGAGLAVATFVKEAHHHQYVQLVMLPMFLFATTFYPLSVYPRPLQTVVAALPLYQSTELVRGLCLGQPGWHLLWAVAYLLVMGTGGLWIAQRRLGWQLLR
jgi:lipooligosaccharide transport system permease protein